MKREELPDLKPFYSWLITDQGKSPATTAAYVSAIRKALLELGRSPSSAEIDAYAAALPTTSNQRGTFRSGWRALVRFAATRGEALANVSDGVLGRPVTVSPSDRIACAAAYLARVIPIAEFPELGWPLVRRTAEWYEVDSPDRTTTYFLAHAPMDALREWGMPEGSLPHVALIPSVPGAQGPKRAARREEVHALVERGRYAEGVPPYSPFRLCPEPKRILRSQRATPDLPPLRDDSDS